MRARGDNGQLLPIYALAVLIAGGAMLVLVHLGTLAVHRAQARTAADAAALAGAAEGRSAADQVAARNGAVIESYSSSGDDVELRVRIGTSHATARARREGGCRSAVSGHPLHFDVCPPISPG